MRSRSTSTWMRLLSAATLSAIVAAGCGATNDTSSPSPTASAAQSSGSGVVSAEDGVAARARYTPLTGSAEAASIEPGVGGSTAGCPTDYVPSADEVAESNAATAGLVVAFDRYGIDYTTSTDRVGLLLVDYGFDDVVAQSVAASYWDALYPVAPIEQAELDAMIATNDIIAEQFDAAGIAYTRRTDDSGWEAFEYDYDDPEAQAAMEQAWLIISPPQPPTPEQLLQQNIDNALVMDAFDEAEIAYELVTDELGWAWLEWDVNDPETSEQYFRIIDELYPPVSIEPVQGCELVDGGLGVDMPTLEAEPIEETADSDASNGAEPETLPIDPDLAPADAERSIAEVDALVDGFSAASVDHRVVGDAPWQTVIFDLDNDASIAVVSAILAARTSSS